MIAAARPHMRRGERGGLHLLDLRPGGAWGRRLPISAAKAALNAAVKGLARPLAAEGLPDQCRCPGEYPVSLAAAGPASWPRTRQAAVAEAMLTRNVAPGPFGHARRRYRCPGNILGVSPVTGCFITGTGHWRRRWRTIALKD